MIKRISAAQHHPTNRTLPDFYAYWETSHGPLFTNTRSLRRYVQHFSLDEARGLPLAPTLDGVSMFWYDDYATMTTPATDPRDIALQRAVTSDDQQLFDRSARWPMHDQRAMVVATEQPPILDTGAGADTMVKVLSIVARMPGLLAGEFFARWRDHHGPLVAQIPGVRRYVQNHAVPEAYADDRQTHDGWSELYFDDIASVERAMSSPQWRAASEDGATLFGSNVGICVSYETIQKELGWSYRDWGASSMSEGAVRKRLTDEGYLDLAESAESVRAICQAASDGSLAVWTPEHLVTIDRSAIDARPSQAR